ncbi:MAG: hypothetical protein EA384_16175 [Spirochaetaceae bacterium]|nr:MAG: hypothetical protein EA384_16175 [Spirochaetaceae bacterium]
MAGDSLGSLVEFRSPSDILAAYPGGVRDLADGGTWDTIAGQPTDDSEMALALAHVLVAHREYTREAAFGAYRDWLDSGPFDVGNTVASALRGQPNPASQANGALLTTPPARVSSAG